MRRSGAWRSGAWSAGTRSECPEVTPGWHSVQSSRPRFGPTGGIAHADGAGAKPCLGGAYRNVPVPVPGLDTGSDRGNPRYETHRCPLVQRDGLPVAESTMPGTTAVDDPIIQRPVGHPVVRHASGRLTHRRP
ncbi:hypothetical protein GCM10023084_21440 [Streptomyces lacrimifluminis]|uniref:Uncharacterized protein n=1 Tax=Streptomyces lacrimifluminis TaxID=1500077 RepID=A0A917NXU2_9ACTN|nr:hypothetical protein GCM10012282_35650 [Streptomyces lacrimifluminis]